MALPLNKFALMNSDGVHQLRVAIQPNDEKAIAPFTMIVTPKSIRKRGRLCWEQVACDLADSFKNEINLSKTVYIHMYLDDVLIFLSSYAQAKKKLNDAREKYMRIKNEKSKGSTR